MNYDIKSLARISLTLDMKFNCDLGVSIQDNDTFMRDSCLSCDVRNIIVCYPTKRLPSDMLYVHEMPDAMLVFLISRYSFEVSNPFQMISIPIFGYAMGN